MTNKLLLANISPRMLKTLKGWKEEMLVNNSKLDDKVRLKAEIKEIQDRIDKVEHKGEQITVQELIKEFT